MIIDISNKSRLQEQISENIRELKDLRRTYQDRININYSRLKDMKKLKSQIEEINSHGSDSDKFAAAYRLTEINNLNSKINFNIIISKEQKNKVNKTLTHLYGTFNMKKDDEKRINKAIKEYNEKYRKLRSNYDNNAVQEERILQNYVKLNRDIAMSGIVPNKEINGGVQNIDSYVQNLKEQVQDLNDLLNENVANLINAQSMSSYYETEKLEKEREKEREREIKIDRVYIDDNDTLLISEIQDKVVLPYFGNEIEEKLIVENDKYKDAQDVINTLFTRKLSDYRNPFKARFKEAFDLVSKRDRFSKLDGVKLGLELSTMKYLHPAIISACRNTDELDTYLDCLRKGEVNDFKIFKIKYELHPMIVKNKVAIKKEYSRT